MAPIPYDEVQRLASLQALDILDTGAEPAFDRITRMAAQQFDVPIALVTLVDSARQWFKSKVGLAVSETPREDSFCQFAIMDQVVLQVPDATQDPRFAVNPLVLGEPKIRFYAGAPLITAKGFRLGTLCLIDTQPRPALDEGQQAQLRDLADMVIREMELRRLHRLIGADSDGIGNEVALALRSLREEDETLCREAQMDVIAHVAHELRTPLGAMLGFAEMIKREHFGAIGDPRYTEYAGRIEECGQHLLEVLSNTLDLARAAQGGLRLVESVISVEETARLAEKLCWGELDKHGARLALDLQSSEAQISADRSQVSQMLVNLISNAARHVPKGSEITVQSRSRSDGGLDLSVIDQGCGMTREAIRKALVPFSRSGGAAQNDHPGLGIGLPLTKRLIEMHGGGLAIDSKPDQGTKMTLRFPAYRVVGAGTGMAYQQACGS